MSCPTCHDPAHAFGPPNALDVQLGGKDMRQPGLRAVPSLKYLQGVPQFTEHYYESDDEGDASIDNGPTGGLTWDGRVDRRRDQARVPLLSPFEMANESASELAAAQFAAGGLCRATCARCSATDVLEDAGKTWRAPSAHALEVYRAGCRRRSIPTAANTTLYLAGRAKLTEQEARGLALFNDPGQGQLRKLPSQRTRQ